MATQGLRIVLNFADAADNKEILKNLTLDYEDLQKIRTARDGVELTDERLRQEDIITLSGLDYDFEKELVSITKHFGEANNYLDFLYNARSNINLNVDLKGRAISPTFKFRKLNFDTGAVSLVDFSTSRRSAWSNFGLAEDSVFYGNEVRISGQNAIDLTDLDIQSELLERRFESQIPTHKITAEINGETYELYAMKGNPVIFRGIFRQGVLDYEYNVLPGGQSPTIVIKDVDNGTEIIYPLINVAPDISSVTQPISLTSVKDRFIEFYYPGDNLIKIIYDDLGITDFPTVGMDSLQILSLNRSLLTELPDLRRYTPNLLNLQLEDNFDIQLTNDTSLRFLNDSIGARIPLTIQTLNLSRSYSGNMSIDFRPFTDLKELRVPSRQADRLINDNFILNPNLEALYIDDFSPSTFLPQIRNHQQLKILSMGGCNWTSVVREDPFNPFEFDWLPQHLVEIQGLQNTLEELKYGGGVQHNYIDTQGFTALRRYEMSSYSLGDLFAGYIYAYSVLGIAEALTLIQGTNFWFGCANLENLVIDGEVPANLIGAFPNFSTNTSLKEITLNANFYDSTDFDPNETREFSIDFNTFGPEEGGCRPTLTEVNLQGMNFNSPVHPDALLGCVSLEIWNLQNIQTPGPIPTLTDCTSLIDFTWINCELNGTVPSFAGLTNLQTINLDTNLLTGQVPSLDLPQLLFLNLTFNELTGFGELKLPNLQTLFAGRNLIQDFPEIGTLTQLRNIELNDNQINNYVTVGGRGPLSDLTLLNFLSLLNNNLSTANIDAILEDLNYNYDQNNRGNVIVDLRGNSAPSPTARIDAILDKLRLTGGWQIDTD